MSAIPAAAAETVKVGITWPLTGNAGAAGQASKAAAELVAEIVNNAHPELGDLPLAKGAGLPNLGGAKLELIFTDHQGNPSLAQQLTTRLITQDKVHVMLGAYQSSCSFTATAVAERYGIPFMVGESAALNITGRGFKWVFRGTPIASDYARTYMRFLRRHEKGRQEDRYHRDRQRKYRLWHLGSGIDHRGSQESEHCDRDPHSLQRELDGCLRAGVATEG
jgi:branched-chain amino acid transport system substrate-binding protein